MKDDVTKFPLNAKAKLGGDQNQVDTVVLSIIHFVVFPADMFDMYYILLEFPLEVFTTKSHFDVTRKSVTSSRIRAIIIQLIIINYHFTTRSSATSFVSFCAFSI